MLPVSFCTFGYSSVCAAQTTSPVVNVRLITDEPEAVLSILNKRKANQQITEDDWRRLFQSEVYVQFST